LPFDSFVVALLVGAVKNIFVPIRCKYRQKSSSHVTVGMVDDRQDYH
jgi:hypothetical protein